MPENSSTMNNENVGAHTPEENLDPMHQIVTDMIAYQMAQMLRGAILAINPLWCAKTGHNYSPIIETFPTIVEDIATFLCEFDDITTTKLDDICLVLTRALDIANKKRFAKNAQIEKASADLGHEELSSETDKFVKSLQHVLSTPTDVQYRDLENMILKCLSGKAPADGGLP